ncbi:hypothetical protein TWF569_007675 [Orbilia oligospora]|uniref:Uncharacterized protein n=1 Tax=Orbilia oligospora TaxID=2813651 RepID=A0A7C8J909_ORBOL|nr:hypothetical protein TWF102_010426 [Orbilia oligospora]KAF3093414.1 hypothetical protein TWF103_010956 [Orbilia oligospora]KAF3107800.1 hypothetical protein TWF706_002613 [Orbilia oligospora]KAF3137851.1 hypothetical protein TWF594_007492 [Orbilia oligospora]KAF3141896.1 hypothetical protein TWF569_007675 [Orbilia oligospora]
MTITLTEVVALFWGARYLSFPKTPSPPPLDTIRAWGSRSSVNLSNRRHLNDDRHARWGPSTHPVNQSFDDHVDQPCFMTGGGRDDSIRSPMDGWFSCPSTK